MWECEQTSWRFRCELIAPPSDGNECSLCNCAYKHMNAIKFIVIVWTWWNCKIIIFTIGSESEWLLCSLRCDWKAIDCVLCLRRFWCHRMKFAILLIRRSVVISHANWFAQWRSVVRSLVEFIHLHASECACNGKNGECQLGLYFVQCTSTLC